MPQDLTYEELIPPEGDKKVGYKVFDILNEVLQDKQDLGLPAKWAHFYELGKNKHWKNTKNNQGVALVAANLLYKHRQRTCNMITGNNPTFDIARIITGEEQEDNKKFDSLLKLTDFWWRETEQQDIFDSSVNNGETYGCCIEKVIFNPELEWGLGEVETETVDPFYFGFYPVNCRNIKKAEANLHFWPMSLREARRRWPKQAANISGDRELLQELGDDRREIKGGMSGAETSAGYLSTLAGVVKKVLNFDGSGKTDGDELIVCEMWVRDYTMKSEPVEHEGQKAVESTPKYTGYIRKITVCNGGKVVLSDQNNPSINPEMPDEEAQITYLYDKFPFILTPSIKDTYSPWGMSDFEQLEGLQKEIDKSISQYTLLKDKAARGKLINPANSGVRDEEFTNYASIIRPSTAEHGKGIGYMPGPQDYHDILKAIELYKDLFFSVAGTFDLEQAQAPGRDVIAFKAIAALLEQAQIMSKNKTSNYCRMIRDRGRMFLSHVQNWYTEDRWISYQDEGVDTPLSINGRDLVLPAKLMVVSGSTMPISKIQQRDEALALYERGAIDRPELLKKLDWPDRKKVLDRMNAGPVGEAMQKLSASGVPPELMEYFQAIISLDVKDIQQDIEKGEMPPAMAVLTEFMQQGEQQQQPEVPPAEQAELAKTQADIQKIMAEVALLQEKTMSEKVDQQVKSEGIGFDTEKMELEKRKLDLDTEKTVRDLDIRDLDSSTKLMQEVNKNSQGPYNEKGLKSNNKKV